uniref:NADH dehydrogenase [ubiquinone] iron-sulfur protein 5 n=1 Tax=Blastobotrys adeninivorans TaxID=409370 RepID=A0A060T5K3_BLAAD
MPGLGINGQMARCFPEWQSFVECYTSKRTTDTKQCKPMAEDYEECLHHRKEKARALQINAELNRQKSEDKSFDIATTKKFTVEQLGLVNN